MEYLYSEDVQSQLDEIDKAINDIGDSIANRFNESAIACQNSEKLRNEYLNKIEPLNKMKEYILLNAVPKIILNKEEYNRIN